MKNIVTLSLAGVLAALLCATGLLAQQPNPGDNEFYLATANPRTNGVDTLTADAGRGIYVAHDPDLDGDGLPEIIVTEYTKGGRVFVYEMIADNTLELVWTSKRLGPNPGGGSTPRTVTTGDFDNNGRQEIIFPVGYVAADTNQFRDRGIYFYEHTGSDNDYGTEPVYKMTYEFIDSTFATVNTGRVEGGMRVGDIDGDGKNELLYPPRQYLFSVAKLYILEVESGTFSGGDAVVEKEYIYDAMVTNSPIAPDGYAPSGTVIGDVDNDGLDEIVVAGGTIINKGGGIGFIQINGPDSYTDGSVVDIENVHNIWIVKSNPIFAEVNGQPVIYLHGSSEAAPFKRQLYTIDGIIADNFVTASNVSEVMTGFGIFSIVAMGDQDHPTSGSGDGLDIYVGTGSRIHDIEYDGAGFVTDSSSYNVTQLYDLRDLYSSLDGLFNDMYAYPGMDLDNDGLRDFVAAYKGNAIDSINGESLLRNGFHIFFFEWGDSSMSDPLVGIEGGGLRVIQPEDYELSQNYPNPFNPSTSIDFTLPISKAISLKIYNTLGQEVRTLVNNQNYASGSHTVVWDGTSNSGSRVASGVYLYKLIYGNFSQSKKMTLIR